MAAAPFVSLYRRYRPGRFSELRGQDHVVRALQSAVRDGRVSHAYLFSGPRGTGKTSSARILAKALNCEAPVDGEPCGVCTSCTEITAGSSMDVHELDAASNNGVDAMRDLVAHAGLGTPGRWKIYIVDEVHMLSTAAANALLKTLEEPPAHVVFVLATTDPQKVPPTIRSRTQHLEFRLLGAETLTGLLESVNDSAGLGLDETAVSAAVRRARGSARDALSALDQVVAAGSSEAARPELSQVIDPLAARSAPDVLVAVSALLSGGWGAQPLATELIDDLRQVFLAALAPDLCAVAGPERDRYTGLAEAMGLPRVVRSIEILGQALIDMREAPDAQVVLEIALVRAVRPDLDSGMEALSERVAVLERSVAGAPAFPRPGPPGAGSPEGSGVGGGADGGGRPPVVASVASAPATSPATLPAEAEPAAEVGTRPSLGALKRSKAAAAAAAPVPATPVETAVAAVAEPSPAEPSASAAPSAAPVPVDRDDLTEAWGDSILRGLPARAKALYSAGRFVSVDVDGGAHFALPNAAHRDRCADMTATVEGKLREHFGTPVRLVLDVDEDATSSGGSGSGSGSGGGGGGEGSGSGSGGGGSGSGGTTGSGGGGTTGSGGAPGAGPQAAPAPAATDGDARAYEPEDEDDPSAFAAPAPDPGDQAKEAEARLLQAFPGASEVAG
jgi:DNA polymerase-3 subunit gamma/tau